MGPAHPRALLGDALRHGFPRDNPYSPEIATWLTGTPGVGDWLRSLPVAPIILVFALFVLLYRTAQTMTNVCFFGLPC